jgi:hypothetical protein
MAEAALPDEIAALAAKFVWSVRSAERVGRVGVRLWCSPSTGSGRRAPHWTLGSCPTEKDWPQISQKQPRTMLDLLPDGQIQSALDGNSSSWWNTASASPGAMMSRVCVPMMFTVTLRPLTFHMVSQSR